VIRCRSNGLVFYRFQSLVCQEEVEHAVFTRIGGTSVGAHRSLNVGSQVGDSDQAVQANHGLVFQALGLEPEQVVTAHQVHGCQVARVARADGGSTLPHTDALICGERGTALLLRFADCLPLMLYDPQRHAIGLVHAGWRGVVRGIVPRAVAEMERVLDCHPDQMLAGLGPAIGPCCYQVGDDLIEQVHGVLGHAAPLFPPRGDGTTCFDLPAAVRSQLERAGVTQIEESGLCTSCRTDEFFSHRAEQGSTGRFAAVLMMRE